MDKKQTSRLVCMCYLILLISLAFPALSFSADEPVTAIKGGDLYTITSGIIKNGTILIKSGKISQIGQNIEIPENAKVIDAHGKIVLPGLVAASAQVGVIGYKDITKIADSLDPFDFSISLALASGVTTAMVSSGRPSRAGPADPIGGITAVIKTTYGDLDHMLIRESVVQPVEISNAQWLRKTKFRHNLQKARTYLRKLAEFEQAKDKKKVEEPKKPSGIDIYVRLLRRELPAALNASTTGDILAALELVDEFGIRMILADAVEAWTVAEEIAKRDVRVIITPRQKRRPNEDISVPSGSTLENAAILRKAGVKFAVVPPSRNFGTGGMPGRDLMALPMEAAFAVSGGLDEQTALEAITITAAEIIGVADRVGSLQVGKDADIIILDGHPFHHKTFVEVTLVNGKVLYEKKNSTYFAHITHDN